MSSPWLWYVSRACGVASMLLLTVVVLAGLFTAARRRPHEPASTLAMGLHRTLGLGMTVFLLTHATTAILDTYVPIGWISAVLPFTSEYERPWVALGTIAFDLFVAVIVTSLLRHRLPTRLWRCVHWFTYAMAPIAVTHGLMMASSTEPLLRGVTIGCGLAMAAGAAWRLHASDEHARRRADIGDQEWV